MRSLFISSTFVLALVVGNCFADTTDSVLANAVSKDQAKASKAVRDLRQQGQKGLDQLTKHFATEISRFRSGETPANWESIAKALDGVASQKDAYSSGLFWYRDLELAKATALKEGKSVLSLRLLGNLDEEYSCANSRFFRSILYTDPDIQKLLRQKFVLHWSSERPAPKITIEFGDGRKLVRTITGNSVHYVIRGDGEVVDALPGLYSPKRFLTTLQTISNRATGRVFLRGNHRALAISALNREVRLRTADSDATPNLNKPLRDNRVDAIDAAPLAVTKMLTEGPTLLSMERQFREISERVSVKDWESIASSEKVRLSRNAVSFIRQKSGKLSHTEFDSMLKRLKKTVAIDTVQNEYRLRPQILRYMGNKKITNLEDLNAWIYKEVFLTGKEDEWLGLYESDIYYGVENNGRLNP